MHLNDYCSSSRLELGRIEVDMPPRRVQLLPRPEPRGIELVPSLLAKLATDYASVSGVTTHSQETTEPEVITVSEGPKGSVSRALKEEDARSCKFLSLQMLLAAGVLACLTETLPPKHVSVPRNISTPGSWH